MDWIDVTAANGEQKLINVNNVMEFVYHKETNLTEVVYPRSAYASTYVRGDILIDIRRLLSAHDNWVSRVGG